MGYRSRPRADGESSEITFLYRLAPGLARASFGIECARLAGVPDEILKVAAGQSKVMAEIAAARTQVVQYVVDSRQSFSVVSFFYSRREEWNALWTSGSGLIDSMPFSLPSNILSFFFLFLGWLLERGR